MNKHIYEHCGRTMRLVTIIMEWLNGTVEVDKVYECTWCKHLHD